MRSSGSSHSVPVWTTPDPSRGEFSFGGPRSLHPSGTRIRYGSFLKGYLSESEGVTFGVVFVVQRMSIATCLGVFRKVMT